ncbi:MAG: hypothetical protein RLZZ350_2264 [Verrucomicrobiota bacterium]|jgi:hypothetical protein
MSCTESIIEDTTLGWFGELDFALWRASRLKPVNLVRSKLRIFYE